MEFWFKVNFSTWYSLSFFVLVFFCGKTEKIKNQTKKKKTSVLKKQLNHYKLLSLDLIMKEDSNAINQIVSFLEQL
jgi:hypothetical protein